MKFQKLIIILAFFLVYPNILSKPLIRLSMRALPDPASIIKKIKKPGKLCKYYIQTLVDHKLYQGIFSTYAGFLGTSDYNGQTLFPLKHSTPFIYLLVTEDIIPISIAANTIHHWELVQGQPAHLFKCEVKPDEDNNFFWHIDSIPLAKNNIIPFQTVIIVANPSYVVIPVGIHVASNNPNIILPDIYIKKGINIVKDALYILNMRHFFKDISMNYQNQSVGHGISLGVQ